MYDVSAQSMIFTISFAYVQKLENYTLPQVELYF